jgi:hypothetical protein
LIELAGKLFEQFGASKVLSVVIGLKDLEA